MRPDMAKIVIDADRHGGYNDIKLKSKKRRPKHKNHLDEMPTKMSMSRNRYGSKHPGDNLAPLYRWLAKQVGRRWDDVYSEINETIQGGFTSIDHVKQHLFERVKLEGIKMIDGWPHYFVPGSRYYSGSPWFELWRNYFYVNDQGILSAPPKGPTPSEKERERSKKEKKVIMLSDLFAVVKIDGTWFAADLLPVPIREVRELHYTSTPTKPVYQYVKRLADVKDALVKKMQSVGHKSQYDSLWDLYGTDSVYAPSIRTMSKKEIKQKIPEKFR